MIPENVGMKDPVQTPFSTGNMHYQSLDHVYPLASSIEDVSARFSSSQQADIGHQDHRLALASNGLLSCDAS